MDNLFWWDLLGKVLVIVIPPVAAALTAMLIAFFKAKWQEYKNSKPNYAWDIETFAAQAVKAAEQMGALAKLKEEAFDKKSYAISVVQSWLAKNKIDIDFEVIEAAVEAAVFEEINKKKQ